MASHSIHDVLASPAGSDTSALLLFGDRAIVARNPVAVTNTWSELSEYIGTHWLVGYLGYEFGYTTVGPSKASVLHTTKSDSLILPDVQFAAFESIVEFGIKEAHLVVADFAKAHPLSQAPILQPTMSFDEYGVAFNSIQQHIAAGNIYQANFSHRLEGACAEPAGELFASLYAQQPSPYSAYINTTDFSIISHSPELGLKIQGGVMESRPMKGTRRREESAEADLAQKQQLLHSTKDQAELDMIIDIHRNDLARTAVPGSVEVTIPKQLQELQTVWQAEAVIQAQQKQSASLFDSIQAWFPAGSVTGAPKIRAMEILYELEPVRRNVYTGSIGFIDPQENCELNVAIRTAILQQKKLYYSVGGGLVFDSELEDEYRESLAKAQLFQS